jgi:HK97 family phage prohead protease
MTMERRTSLGSIQGSERTLHGLVTPFNVWTTIGNMAKDGFNERIAPGAFAKTLRERDVVLIHNHNPDYPLARTSVRSGVGSLELREDPSAGLRAVAEPVQTTIGVDVLLLAKTGVIRGMSFGFEVIKDSWADSSGRAASPQSGTHRTVQEVKLYEVTTTAFPAYETSQLSARGSSSAVVARFAAARSATAPVTSARKGKAAKPLSGKAIRAMAEDMKRRDAEWAKAQAAQMRAEDAKRYAELAEFFRVNFGG